MTLQGCFCCSIHTHSFPHFSLTMSAQTLNFLNANIPSGLWIQFFQMAVHGGILNSTILSLPWSFLNDHLEMYNLKICIKIIFPPFQAEIFFPNSIHPSPLLLALFFQAFCSPLKNNGGKKRGKKKKEKAARKTSPNSIHCFCFI